MRNKTVLFVFLILVFVSDSETGFFPSYMAEPLLMTGWKEERGDLICLSTEKVMLYQLKKHTPACYEK